MHNTSAVVPTAIGVMLAMRMVFSVMWGRNAELGQGKRALASPLRPGR
jgi:hypothetical protein